MAPISGPPFPDRLGGDRSDEVHVTLPCAPDHFAEFITGLLGRPQTISRRFSMLFSVDRTDLESLHHLIVQRIGQQNDATLVQFVVVITFDDHSSVRITSFDDFRRYNEVRPLRSVAVLLNWVFLIRFPDRRQPEKQEISIRFVMPEYESRHDYMPHDFYRIVERHYHFGSMSAGGTIEVYINYTARTWGNDVDNLIKGHIESIERHDNPLLSWIIKHSGAVGFWIAIILFAIGITGLVIYADRVDKIRSDEIAKMFIRSDNQGNVTLNILRYLLEQQSLLSSRISGAEFFGAGGLFIIIIVIILGVLTSSLADRMARSSHVVLTKRSEKHAQDRELKHKRRIMAFAGIQAFNILVGLALLVLSNTISEYWAV